MKISAMHYINKKPYRMGYLEPHNPENFEKNSKKDILRMKRDNFLSNASDLYHYTSLVGFQGIIESGGFWVSDNRYLNDSQEVIHGKELCVSFLDQIMKKRRFGGFRDVLEGVKYKISNNTQVGHLIACFSEARDSLEQWRGYGDYTGICIRTGGMLNQPSRPTYKPLFFGPGQLPHSVKYEWRSKIITLFSIINLYYKEYKIDRRAMEEWPEDHDKNYTEAITTDLEIRIPSFKNWAFKEEKEVRIIIPYSNQKVKDMLRFRPSKFGLIPYVCTEDTTGIGGLMPIKEVIIGPSQNKEIVAESVDTFMKHNGYEEVKITMSKVPYRN